MATDSPWTLSRPTGNQMWTRSPFITCPFHDLTLTRAHKATSDINVSSDPVSKSPQNICALLFPQNIFTSVNGCRFLWESLGNYYCLHLFAKPSSWVPDLSFSQWILVLRTAPDVKTGKLPSFLITHPGFYLSLGTPCSFNHIHNSLWVSTLLAPHDSHFNYQDSVGKVIYLAYTVSESCHPHHYFWV